MTTEEFFAIQSERWNKIKDGSHALEDIRVKYLRGGSVKLSGTVTVDSAAPYEASKFVASNRVFVVDDPDALDDIVTNFIDRNTIELELTLKGRDGWANSYRAEVVAVDTEDADQDKALDPESAVVVVSDWMLLGSEQPKKYEATSVRKDGKTDLELFGDYIRKLRTDAFEHAKGDGMPRSWCGTFQQVTDSEGKTTVKYRINGSDERTTVFDRNGKMLSDCGGEWCGGHKCGCAHQSVINRE